MEHVLRRRRRGDEVRRADASLATSASAPSLSITFERTASGGDPGPSFESVLEMDALRAIVLREGYAKRPAALLRPLPRRAVLEPEAAEAAEAEAEMRRPKPPPHPRSLRLRLQDDDLGDGFTEALQGLLPVVEAALSPLEVRPHWGKVFTLKQEQVASQYPRLDEFKGLLRDFDPDGKFRNPYLERYLFD